ncbi:DUF2804 domain-containing protein [Streptomyces zhihengii]
MAALGGLELGRRLGPDGRPHGGAPVRRGWTRGTGSTENALCVDGRLSKIGDELEWDWSPADHLAPWRVRTPAGTRWTWCSPRSTTAPPGPRRS